jgi:hypothetical protein
MATASYRDLLVASALLFSCVALLSAPAAAAPVFVPDNGFGTAQMPILADYVGETPMQIIDGLPAFTTIDIDAVLKTPPVYGEVPGGSLGGTKSGGGTGTLFHFEMQGTGAMAGYNRIFDFPAATSTVLTFNDPPFDVNPGSFEVHAAPRANNAPLQSFDTDMFRLFNQITNPGAGDPDFDLLRIVAGSDFGLPSPGHTTLLQSGPNWEVDSFFDITYRIDFVGKPGGPFSGMSGSTTGTVKFSVGDPIVPEPASGALAGIGAIALAALIWRRRSRRHE